MDTLDILPKDLDEALDMLEQFFGKETMEKIASMDEDEFRKGAHFGHAAFIRNAWQLWWYEGHQRHTGWSKTKPLLNKWFEDIGITHADDMSSIIITCLHRKARRMDYDLVKQVKKYQDHWKKNGYTDGIPRHE